MSSKATLKCGAGFHLYRETSDDGADEPVYLELEGICFDVKCTTEAERIVTVRIPGDVWRDLTAG